MLRVLLLQLGEQEHIFLVVKHHIAWDGWSSEILWKELTALYEAFISGEPSPLPELPIQYADYAVWQRDRLQGEILERQLSYWKKQLDGIGTLQLPTDRPRPSVRSYQGKRQTLELSKQLSQKLRALSRQQGTTLFMTLLAAFQTLLYRYTGQEDIAVGCPIAGRTRQELEGLIGFFVNTLVMRVDFSGNPTFRELLARVREVALGAYGHQDLPFEKLVEDLQPERNLSYTPLFQVAFAYQSTPNHALEIPGVHVTPVEKIVEATKFDLHLSVNNADERIGATLYYATDLYDDVTIARLLGHFRVLLEGIVEDPDRRLSELPILTEGEKRQLLVEWNDTRRDYPKDKCIHQLFEQQVEKSPDAVAVVFEDQQLTYRELNTRANQLARYLRKLGVRPETLVGICVERSLEMAVGLLGILKAGGTYVPLDPDYPKERLAFMLEDTRARVLLTQQRFIDGLPAQNTHVVCLDTDWGAISKESVENPDDQVSGAETSYVIYTSGSTGTPKGVAVPHSAVNRLVINTNYINLTSDDVVAQISNCSFDAATFEIWGALLNGARLAIITKDIVLAPEQFAGELKRHGITTLFLTTALFNLLAREVPGAFRQLRHLLFGGEAAEPRWVAKVLQDGPPERLLHVYGPTETTTFATWQLVDEVPDGATTIPIGRPIASTTCYILDASGQPVPIGVAGEMYIGGDGLAREYLNRPELTAEKFIPHPFSHEPGARLYKTGDLARYLPDGNIEFLGRTDHQVKIRGFRIELGEIEAILKQHPAVRETVVLAHEDEPQDIRLVAYLVSEQSPAPSPGELLGFLKSKLPSYMIPSTFVSLETLPLTPNGKVDRRALPAPGHARPKLDESFTAPRTPVEELLTSICAEVLKLEKVGIHDNFFELGGHSLLATQVMSRVREVFQVELPLRCLFESPTVAGLAERIEVIRREEGGLLGLPILPVPRDGDLPLSFAQERLWFLDQYEPGTTVYNIPSALRLRGSFNIGALEQSLNEIIRRHESLRTTFSMIDGEAVQVIAPSLGVSVPVIDLRDHPEEREEEARELAREEACQPFDLARGPLFRSQLLRLGEDDHVLLLTMHHIVSDGWSMGVLHRELSMLYRAFVNGQPSPLEDLPIQYADFAVWQREWLQGEVLDRQLSYWKTQLEGIPAVLNLPMDHPRPGVQSYRGGRQSIELSRELAQELKQLSRKEGVTLFMTLLAAFQTLLYRYTGQEDIVVGSPIANRNRSEIEGLIGFFVNTLALRTKFDGDPTFKELLARVRQTTLGAYENQDLPFEKLVEGLKPERNLSYSPLFQVMFVLQNAPSTSLVFEGLNVSPVAIGVETAKFDLTLSISETEEGLRGSLHYNTDLFDDATISRMSAHWQTLLKALVAEPEQHISQLPILTEAEERRLLVEWNDTTRDYPQDKCIHQLLEEQVRRTPDAVAVIFEDQRFTYRELNARANQLAHHLRKHGVGPDAPVGICLERSLEMVVGLLGILKAGGAYVPMDPFYPVKRLAFVLRDAGVRVLLTERKFSSVLYDIGFTASLEAGHPVMICLDVDWDRVAQESQEPPANKTAPDNVAYVIYTSGSTGNPKGVMISHRSLCNRIFWGQQFYRLSGADSVLQAFSLSFDFATWEIFTALAGGARLVLARPESDRDSTYLVRLIAGRRITVAGFVPSMLEAILQEPGIETCDSLRKVFSGGEMLPRLLQDRFHARLNAELQNTYGPTEAAIDVTYWVCERGAEVWSDRLSVPIGRPIANIRIYVLDVHLQPVPVGVSGELHLGGIGLARGYVNSPDLTSEKFIPNPFSEEPGACLYKTGDLVRYLPDGNIEFLGRIDQQVKIRGYRIEVGEIEKILDQHPAVKETVLLAREDASGDKRLVAYTVLRSAQTLEVTEARSFLKEKLPAYMVPSEFVFLDRLPLTSNGKIDRKALPAPDQRRPELEKAYVAPRTPVEEMIAEIWAEVLKVHTVGVHDNFFDLGGHSLLATQIISRLREAFRVDLPLRALFEDPTVVSLAVRIALLQAKGNAPETLVDVLARLESCSDEEAQLLLAEENSKAI